MRKIGIFVLLVAVSVFAVFSFTGCAEKMAEKMVEKAMEKAIEEEGSGEVDIDFDSGEITIEGEEDGEEVNINISEEGMTIEGEDGDAEFSMGGTELPDGWPSEIPVNPDLSIIFSGKDSANDKTNYTISAMYDGNGKELFSWYTSEFSNWNEDYNTVMDSEGGKNYSAQFSNNDYDVTIIIQEAEGEVSLVQGVAEK